MSLVPRINNMNVHFPVVVIQSTQYEFTSNHLTTGAIYLSIALGAGGREHDVPLIPSFSRGGEGEDSEGAWKTGRPHHRMQLVLLLHVLSINRVAGSGMHPKKQQEKQK